MRVVDLGQLETLAQATPEPEPRAATAPAAAAGQTQPVTGGGGGLMADLPNAAVKWGANKLASAGGGLSGLLSAAPGSALESLAFSSVPFENISAAGIQGGLGAFSIPMIMPAVFFAGVSLMKDDPQMTFNMHHGGRTRGGLDYDFDSETGQYDRAMGGAAYLPDRAWREDHGYENRIPEATGGDLEPWDYSTEIARKRLATYGLDDPDDVRYRVSEQNPYGIRASDVEGSGFTPGDAARLGLEPTTYGDFLETERQRVAGGEPWDQRYAKESQLQNTPSSDWVEYESPFGNFYGKKSYTGAKQQWQDPVLRQMQDIDNRLAQGLSDKQLSNAKGALQGLAMGTPGWDPGDSKAGSAFMQNLMVERYNTIGKAAGLGDVGSQLFSGEQQDMPARPPLAFGQLDITRR